MSSDILFFYFDSFYFFFAFFCRERGPWPLGPWPLGLWFPSSLWVPWPLVSRGRKGPLVSRDPKGPLASWFPSFHNFKKTYFSLARASEVAYASNSLGPMRLSTLLIWSERPAAWRMHAASA